MDYIFKVIITTKIVFCFTEVMLMSTDPGRPMKYSLDFNK